MPITWNVEPSDIFVVNNQDGTFEFKPNTTTTPRQYRIIYTDNGNCTGETTYTIPTGNCNCNCTCNDISISPSTVELGRLKDLEDYATITFTGTCSPGNTTAITNITKPTWVDVDFVGTNGTLKIKTNEENTANTRNGLVTFEVCGNNCTTDNKKVKVIQKGIETTCYDILFKDYDINRVDLILASVEDIPTKRANITDEFNGYIIKNKLGQKCVYSDCTISEVNYDGLKVNENTEEAITNWTPIQVSPNQTYNVFRMGTRTFNNEKYYDFVRIGSVNLTTDLTNTCQKEYLEITPYGRPVTIKYTVEFGGIEKAQINAVLKYGNTAQTITCIGTAGSSSSGIKTGSFTYNTDMIISEFVETCSWDLLQTEVKIVTANGTFECDYNNGFNKFFYSMSKTECRAYNLPEYLRCEGSTCRCNDNTSTCNICIPYTVSVRTNGNDEVIAIITFGLTRE